MNRAIKNVERYLSTLHYTCELTIYECQIMKTNLNPLYYDIYLSGQNNNSIIFPISENDLLMLDYFHDKGTSFTLENDLMTEYIHIEIITFLLRNLMLNGQDIDNYINTFLNSRSHLYEELNIKKLEREVKLTQLLNNNI
jgi:hypothetical protein